MKKILIGLFLLSLLSFPAFAYHGSDHIYLLAISERSDGNFTGSLADLFLDVKPGKGRVFIDTYPFTKLDTQFTTRYAKNFACNYIDKDCSSYDFFYTVKAASTIIGGPSAGAATALLTAAMIDDREIPKDISVTGTIGSGGIIGPVGGVKEKIIAAADFGLKKVYIPKISGLNDSEIINITLNYGIQVIPVSNFDELYSKVFGIEPKKNHEAIEPTTMYLDTMREISDNLCNDAKSSYDGLNAFNLVNSSYIDSGMTLYNQSINETIKGNYYSAASFCFGASSRFETQKVLLMNSTSISRLATELSIDYLDFYSDMMNTSINGFTDLQAYMVTMQRLVETSEYLFSFNFSKKENFSDDELEKLAFAKVRFNSAVYWSEFLGIEKDEGFVFDDSALLSSCLGKINEVEGYLNYVRDYLGLPLPSAKSYLDKAYDDYYKEDYALCLFKAIKAKADAELILTTMSVEVDDIPNLISQKEAIARNAIGESIENGIFPILAYSYYSYGKSLNSSDPYSSLLYLEYARAMSDISVYFEKEKFEYLNVISLIPKEFFILFVLGFMVGGASASIVFLSIRALKEKRSLGQKKKRSVSKNRR